MCTPKLESPLPTATIRSRQTKLLKERHENIPLGQLTPGTIKQAFQYWASRPLKKGTERPITVRSAENYFKRWRHFLWWLHDAEQFRWKAPSELSRIKVKIRQTEKVRQATISPLQVKVFTEEELVVLFQYATPLERVYLLLGLNCGFSIAEFGMLRLDQIFWHRKHGFDNLIHFQSSPNDSWIKRVRLKSDEHLRLNGVSSSSKVMKQIHTVRSKDKFAQEFFEK